MHRSVVRHGFPDVEAAEPEEDLIASDRNGGGAVEPTAFPAGPAPADRRATRDLRRQGVISTGRRRLTVYPLGRISTNRELNPAF
ncbi:hypothetical protein [Amycolatopsis solani]|uniref:hypothetical protein n=1 Tax=Amycolatopsis solani TaxID=3028615 RepID=UPI0025B03D54|nr:hypothetical protein [Amycolatopsis sp. MEP2-6]